MGLSLFAPAALALPTVPGVSVSNDDWAIIMTDEGYSDVAVDQRPGFAGREYLSGEWAAAIFYVGGANPGGPIWLRKQWGFPCWDSNSNFVVTLPMTVASPPTNSDGFLRLQSAVSNGDIMVTMTYEMLDTVTGIAQGGTPASSKGTSTSSLSNRYVFKQTYVVKNVSGGPLTGVTFYQFLHGLNSGTSIYDDRDYGGALGTYRYDNTQTGTNRSINVLTGEIFSHADTVCMHAMVPPSAIECGYYGKDGVDNHEVGKPSVGVHLSVEAHSLNGEDDFDPPEERWVSGAMSFNFPDLADNAEHTISALLSITSVSTFVAPPPEIAILDRFIDGSEFVLDFTETTGAPLDGFLLWSSKTLEEPAPAGWTQVPIPRIIDFPTPGASRFRIPIDPATNPECFFSIQPFVQ